MLRWLFLPAVLTGVFCAAFTLAIDLATDMIARNLVVVLSFISGFCGSIFARLVLGKGQDT